MNFTQVPTDPNRMIILHRPKKRSLTNVKELHEAMVSACACGVWRAVVQVADGWSDVCVFVCALRFSCGLGSTPAS